MTTTSAWTNHPTDMYGKVMSLSDSLMMDYFYLITDVPDEDLAEMRRALETQSVNPMDLKKRLGREIVAQFHDDQAGDAGGGQFRKHVSAGETRRRKCRPYLSESGPHCSRKSREHQPRPTTLSV